MDWIWRVLIGGLLLGGVTVVVPVMATQAAGGADLDGSTVLRPAGNDNNPCNSGNPRKQKKCHYNNQDNVDVSDTVQTDGQYGAAGVNGDVSIDLWRSTDKPVANQQFRIGVTGNGAPIAFVEWWADSPGGNGGDDLGSQGHVSQDCGGSWPCTLGSDVVARNVGWYVLHARVVDTNGHAVQTDWQFLASSNARS